MISNRQTFPKNSVDVPSRLTLSGLVVVPWSRATTGRANLQRRWNCAGDGALKTSLICFEYYTIYIYILCTCDIMAFLDIYIYRQLQTCMWIYFFIYAYIYIIMIKWDEWNDMYELGCTLLWHSHFGFPRMVWRRCCSFIDTVGYVSSGQLDRGFQQASIDLQFGVIQATQLYDRYSIGWRCQVLLFYMNILYVLAGFIHMNAYIYTHTHI